MAMLETSAASLDRRAVSAPIEFSGASKKAMFWRMIERKESTRRRSSTSSESTRVAGSVIIAMTHWNTPRMTVAVAKYLAA